MTLSLTTLRPVIWSLIFILFATSFLGFVSFLAAQKAQAVVPVTDALGIVAGWVKYILERAWSVFALGVEKATAWAVAKASKALDWLRDNARAVLYAAGLKLAAKFLLAEVQKLIAKNRIQSYLYYADFLVRNVYAIEQINKLSSPECENNPDTAKCNGEKQNKLILLNLITEGRQLYGRLTQGTTAYEGIKQATLLNPKCQTYNLEPQAPDYYVRLLESKGPDCIPQFVRAGFMDAALTNLSAAEQAAQAEIASGGGYQAGRQCGEVATKDVFSTTADEIKIVGQNPDGTLKTTGGGIKPVKAGQAVDVLPTVSSVLCTVINYPAGQMNTVINGMISKIIDVSTKADASTNSTQLRQYLSDTMATTIYKLMNTCSGNTVAQFVKTNLRLASSCSGEDRSFTNEVPPGIDPGLYTLNQDNTVGGTPPSQRDEANLREFWNDFCDNRLPQLFAFKNGNYVGGPNAPAPSSTDITNGGINSKGQIRALDSGALREGSIKFITGSANDGQGGRAMPFVDFLPSRAVLTELFGENGTISVDKMLKNKFGPVSGMDYGYNPAIEGGAWYQDGSDGRKGVASYVASPAGVYHYIWQIYEDHRDNTKDGYDDELAISRKYWTSRFGFPSPRDIKDSTNWIPTVWPYFVDENGTGYKFTLNGPAPDSSGGTGGGGGGPGGGNDGSSGDGGGTRLYQGPQQNWFAGLFKPETAQAETLLVDPYAANRIDADTGNDGKGKIYLVKPGSTSAPQELQNVRIYDINGDIIAMWPGLATDFSLPQERMWKLNKSVSVVITNGKPVINPNSLRLSADGTAAVIEYVDKQTGQKKVLGAVELEKQKPCAAQPYGPPTDLTDIGSKIYYSRLLTSPDGGKTAPLWNWVMEKVFIRNNAGGSF